jgi:cell division protein DivIC
MKNPSKKVFENNSWLQFLSNKYFIVSVFFIVWIGFLDNYSRVDHLTLDEQIDELIDNKNYYIQETNNDKAEIKKLKKPVEIEKYAREKYYMKKENEDIYIIEFEGDTLE